MITSGVMWFGTFLRVPQTKAVSDYTMLNPSLPMDSRVLSKHLFWSGVFFLFSKPTSSGQFLWSPALSSPSVNEHPVSIHGEDPGSGYKLTLCLWLPLFLYSYTSPHLTFSNLWKFYLNSYLLAGWPHFALVFWHICSCYKLVPFLFSLKKSV